MKKVAILSFYSGYTQRGVENWTHEMATRLSKKNEVVVFGGRRDNTNKYKTFSPNLKINWGVGDKTYTFWRRYFLDYWSRMICYWTLKVLPNLWKEKYDIVIPTNGGWQSLLVRLVTWFYGGKVVVVGHSGRGWDDKVNLFTFPDTFVSLSEANLKWAKKANPFISVVSIPNGVDLEKFNAKGETSRVNLKMPIVIAAGALETGKRMDLAVKAVSKLNNVSLLILGDGSKKVSLENLGRKLLRERFFIKSVPHNEISKYLRAGQLFTLPSWSSEAFGLVYLEAMACGLPIVATDDAIRREIVGNAGILVDPQNIEQFAEAIKKALTTKWGNKPREQAEKFSWDNVVKMYEQLFDKLLK